MHAIVGERALERLAFLGVEPGAVRFASPPGSRNRSFLTSPPLRATVPQGVASRPSTTRRFRRFSADRSDRV